MTDAHGLYPTLVAVSPVLDTADIVATATGVIKAKLHSLQENPNACYWREVVHVVWEQLWLPPGFVMPNHVIATDCWMPSPAMVEQMKSWPDWDKIVDAPNADLQDHAWAGNPIPLHAHPATIVPPAKPQPHYLPIHQLLAHPVRGVHQARAPHPASQGDQAAITPSPTGKLTVLDGVAIVTPSWLTTTSQPSTPGSVAANTGSTPPTTPSGTGLAGSDNTARIDTLEAKVLVLKKELVVKSHQLDDTWHEVSSLCNIVEAFQQEHYPLAQGLMGPIHHTTTPQPGPMPPSTCHVITPAMVTPLGYTWQVDLALITMVEEVPSHQNTQINDTSEVQQQPPAPALIEDAPTHTDGATVPDTPLVPATPAIIVSTLDDAILIGNGEDNGANDMHVD
ncbi:hypothetical protein V8B97DRAFT_2004781 [Scleroderma yunnanense]